MARSRASHTHSSSIFLRKATVRINVDLLKKVFAAAMTEFLKGERNSLRDDISERNSCARLGYHLQNCVDRAGFKGYYADPDYNRKQGGQVKTILDQNFEIVTIQCDLLLHSRGEIVGRDNLVAIEMKKSYRPQTEKDDDRKRLRAMTKKSDGVWSYDGRTHPDHVCGYMLGVFIEVDRTSESVAIEYYRNGKFRNADPGTWKF